MKEHMNIHRGDIYYADLEPVVGSEQGGTRPVVIIQNEVGNRFSPTVIVAAVTTSRGKLPTHVALNDHIPGLRTGSVILLEQIRTLDRIRLKQYIGKLSAGTLQMLDTALGISIGLENNSGAHPNRTGTAFLRNGGS